MTAIAIKKKVAEWNKIFPKNMTVKYTSSVTFMKQLTTVAISEIAYLRNAFPEDSYITETFAGLKLKILKNKCPNVSAQFLSTSLTQAFDAFDKKYLHKLALLFHDGEPILENIFEYYVFEYSYNPGEKNNSEMFKVNVHSKTQKAQQTIKCSDDVIKRTINMIENLKHVIESYHQDLPNCYNSSILLYYNKDAPENYQAPGYNRCEEELVDNSMLIADRNKEIGYVETPFHKLLLSTYIEPNTINDENTANLLQILEPTAHQSTHEDLTVLKELFSNETAEEEITLTELLKGQCRNGKRKLDEVKTKAITKKRFGT